MALEPDAKNPVDTAGNGSTTQIGQSAPALLLFDAATYKPDTVDFRHDSEAKHYWFAAYRPLIGKFVSQAAANAIGDEISVPEEQRRACEYRDELLAWMDALDLTGSQPISMRTMLDQSGVLLRKHGFFDAWREAKRSDNEYALGQFAGRVRELDDARQQQGQSTTASADYWLELVRGVLAGNVLDWGAQAVTELRSQHADRPFGLETALQLVQQRPWLFDDFDAWLRRLNEPTGHRCAAVFVDNSGIDIVLGVMPFVRELLRRGTRVILCANRLPSLNDVTAEEMPGLVDECGRFCEVLAEARRDGRLMIADNGQTGPCLDMRHLSAELTELMRTERVDLLVIEGMGRALLTNFSASFACDTLKLAVVKNAWWAKRLGGAIFDVICKFEAAAI